MYSRGLQKVIFFVVIVLIFLSVYWRMGQIYQTLPSSDWSKDEPLFSYETDTNYESFFNKQLTYMTFNHAFHIIYVEDDVVKFKVYSMKLEPIEEGQLMNLNQNIDELYVMAYEDYFEVVVLSEDLFNCYRFNKALKVVQTYSVHGDSIHYYVSNGHIVFREGDHYRLVSAKGSVVLNMPYRPYDLISEVFYESDYLIYYITLQNGERVLYKDTYDEEGMLITTTKIAPLLVDDMRITPLDFEVFFHENIETYKINLKDKKFGTTYLNYYQYDELDQQVLYTQNFSELQDQTYLISNHEIIGLFNHEITSKYLDSSYYDFFNVMKFDLTTGEFKALTRTFKGPREYQYLATETYDYLIWGELSKGRMTVRIASNDPDYIDASLVLTSERLMDIFYDTVDTFMKIPTYVIVTSLFVLAVTMIIVMPGYMLFVTFFEKHFVKVFFMLMVLHNIAKWIIHQQFIHRAVVPEILSSYGWLIFLLTNSLGIYSYAVARYHKKFDNPIVAYVPFYITDILLHTMIFGPFIMLHL